MLLERVRDCSGICRERRRRGAMRERRQEEERTTASLQMETGERTWTRGPDEGTTRLRGGRRV